MGIGDAACDGLAEALADALADDWLGLWVVLIETGGWPQAASNAATGRIQTALRINRGQL